MGNQGFIKYLIAILLAISAIECNSNKTSVWTQKVTSSFVIQQPNDTVLRNEIPGREKIAQPNLDYLPPPQSPPLPLSPSLEFRPVSPPDLEYLPPPSSSRTSSIRKLATATADSLDGSSLFDSVTSTTSSLSNSFSLFEDNVIPPAGVVPRIVVNNNYNNNNRAAGPSVNKQTTYFSHAISAPQQTNDNDRQDGSLFDLEAGYVDNPVASPSIPNPPSYKQQQQQQQRQTYTTTKRPVKTDSLFDFSSQSSSFGLSSDPFSTSPVFAPPAIPQPPAIPFDDDPAPPAPPVFIESAEGQFNQVSLTWAQLQAMLTPSTDVASIISSITNHGAAGGATVTGSGARPVGVGPAPPAPPVGPPAPPVGPPSPPRPPSPPSPPSVIGSLLPSILPAPVTNFIPAVTNLIPAVTNFLPSRPPSIFGAPTNTGSSYGSGGYAYGTPSQSDFIVPPAQLPLQQQVQQVQQQQQQQQNAPNGPTIIIYSGSSSSGQQNDARQPSSYGSFNPPSDFAVAPANPSSQNYGSFNPPAQNVGSFNPPSFNPPSQNSYGSFNPPAQNPTSFNPPSQNYGSFNPPSFNPPSQTYSSSNPPAQNPPSFNPPAQNYGPNNPPTQNPPTFNPPAQNYGPNNPPSQNPPTFNPPAQNYGQNNPPSVQNPPSFNPPSPPNYGNFNPPAQNPPTFNPPSQNSYNSFNPPAQNPISFNPPSQNYGLSNPPVQNPPSQNYGNFNPPVQNPPSPNFATFNPPAQNPPSFNPSNNQQFFNPQPPAPIQIINIPQPPAPPPTAVKQQYTYGTQSIPPASPTFNSYGAPASPQIIVQQQQPQQQQNLPSYVIVQQQQQNPSAIQFTNSIPSYSSPATAAVFQDAAPVNTNSYQLPVLSPAAPAAPPSVTYVAVQQQQPQQIQVQQQPVFLQQQQPVFLQQQTQPVFLQQAAEPLIVQQPVIRQVVQPVQQVFDTVYRPVAQPVFRVPFKQQKSKAKAKGKEGKGGGEKGKGLKGLLQRGPQQTPSNSPPASSYGAPPKSSYGAPPATYYPPSPPPQQEAEQDDPEPQDALVSGVLQPQLDIQYQYRYSGPPIITRGEKASKKLKKLLFKGAVLLGGLGAATAAPIVPGVIAGGRRKRKSPPIHDLLALPSISLTPGTDYNKHSYDKEESISQPETRSPLNLATNNETTLSLFDSLPFQGAPIPKALRKELSRYMPPADTFSDAECLQQSFCENLVELDGSPFQESFLFFYSALSPEVDHNQWLQQSLTAAKKKKCSEFYCTKKTKSEAEENEDFENYVLNSSEELAPQVVVQNKTT